MEQFLVACRHRAADGALHQAIRASTSSLLPAGPPLWRIEWRAGRGRVLVASQDLEGGTLVFCERPHVVAPVVDTGDAANRGEAQAVAAALLAMPAEATALLCSPAHVADTPEAASLARAADAFAAGCPAHDAQRARHCLGVASVNVHSAARPTRGVLGVLSSMMVSPNPNPNPNPDPDPDPYPDPDLDPDPNSNRKPNSKPKPKQEHCCSPSAMVS